MSFQPDIQISLCLCLKMIPLNQKKCEFLPNSLMMKMMTTATMMVMTMMMMMMNFFPAPSPPGRVVAVSGGTGDLLVAWTPPKQPNGRLLQYTVTLIFKKH